MDRAAGHPHSPLQLPSVQLPAGITDAQIQQSDQEMAGQLLEMTADRIHRLAGEMLRGARRTQRRASGRPACKRKRQQHELLAARQMLITAGILARCAEHVRAGLAVSAIVVARARERCERQIGEEPGRFAVTVENWIRDLAGHERLDRA